LITEAGVMFGGAPSEDEMYTAEAFYSATESTSRDARLFALWAWKFITGGHHDSAGFAEEPPI
ncbi:MAG TPA: hypothetical protein VHB50_13130, partial [Bryobacteraceae bacterium]|nr:hypothetical protein [Bryobacteraceae bacterium]